MTTQTLAELLPMNIVEPFCKKWRIAELYVFGSAARGEMREDSDIDLIYKYDDHGPAWTLFDEMKMRDEASELLGRHVDLVPYESAMNSRSFRARRMIRRDATLVYQHEE